MDLKQIWSIDTRSRACFAR